MLNRRLQELAVHCIATVLASGILVASPASESSPIGISHSYFIVKEETALEANSSVILSISIRNKSDSLVNLSSVRFKGKERLSSGLPMVYQSNVEVAYVDTLKIRFVNLNEPEKETTREVSFPYFGTISAQGEIGILIEVDSPPEGAYKVMLISTSSRKMGSFSRRPDLSRVYFPDSLAPYIIKAVTFRDTADAGKLRERSERH